MDICIHTNIYTYTQIHIKILTSRYTNTYTHTILKNTSNLRRINIHRQHTYTNIHINTYTHTHKVSYPLVMETSPYNSGSLSK